MNLKTKWLLGVACFIVIPWIMGMAAYLILRPFTAP